MVNWVFLLTLLTFFGRTGFLGASLLNFTRLYEDARTHYLDEQWEQTVASFEDLLVKWKAVIGATRECRRGCGENRTQIEDYGNGVQPPEIEAIVATAACQWRCRPSFVCDNSVEKLIRRNVPYNYLQLAYYK